MAGKIKKIKIQKLYKCSECGLIYKDKTYAKQCESWCREHKSCNLDIIEHAEIYEKNHQHNKIVRCCS